MMSVIINMKMNSTIIMLFSFMVVILADTNSLKEVKSDVLLLLPGTKVIMNTIPILHE